MFLLFTLLLGLDSLVQYKVRSRSSYSNLCMVSNCKQSSLAESVQKSLQNSRHVCSHSAGHIYSRHFHRTVQTIAFPIWRFRTLKNKQAQFLHFLCNVQLSAFCNRLLKFKFLTVKFSYT